MTAGSMWRPRSTWLLMTAGLLTIAGLVALAVLATASTTRAQENGVAPGDLAIVVHAEVLEADAPATAVATAVSDMNGQPGHHVRVTWLDHARAMLDDVRFTHHVTAEAGEGDLVLAGRGCGADWSDDQAQVAHICTADFQIIQVASGEAHDYPVRVHPEVGPLRLEAGVYVVDQVVQWWRPDAEDVRDQFTIRLTYTVGETGPGLLVPQPAASGISLVSWSGGSIEALPLALSYWVTVAGELIGYVPGAPDFVNIAFLEHFEDGEIPAGTALIVVTWWRHGKYVQ
jgi:hypothetical protein